jgi:hypothetical protein
MSHIHSKSLSTIFSNVTRLLLSHKSLLSQIRIESEAVIFKNVIKPTIALVVLKYASLKDRR